MEEEGKGRVQNDAMGEGLALPLLTLKMEEKGHEPKNTGGLSKLEKARVSFRASRKKYSPANPLIL